MRIDPDICSCRRPNFLGRASSTRRLCHKCDTRGELSYAPIVGSCDRDNPEGGTANGDAGGAKFGVWTRLKPAANLELGFS